MNRFERFLEWYGLTCTSLMNSDSRWRRFVGGAMTIISLLAVMGVLGIWLLFGKKPKSTTN